MKRIIALSALIMLIASSAYAVDIAGGAAITATNNTTSTTASLGKLSTNVSLTVEFNNVTFASVTKHLSGNRGFGTSSADTRIYYKELAAGQAAPALGLSASDSADFTASNGWVSL